MGIGAIWLLVKGFLGGISPRAWAYVGIGVAVLSGLAYVHHHGAAGQKIKDDKVIVQIGKERDQALEANGTNIATITALKDSLTSCESGRIADQAAQSKAMAERNKATIVAQAAYAKARADMDALNKGRCQSTAKRAVCGATP